MQYRRTHIPGATVFLTLVTRDRAPVLLNASVRTAMSAAVLQVAQRHPFATLAYSVLPDHCHLLWRLLADDGDVSLRVRLLKHFMARQPGLPERIWQRHFWDHLIRDERDLHQHLDFHPLQSSETRPCGGGGRVAGQRLPHLCPARVLSARLGGDR